jgi:serine/threonine protein kinase
VLNFPEEEFEKVIQTETDEEIFDSNEYDSNV